MKSPRILACVLSVAALLFHGCASPTQSGNMATSSMNFGKQHPKTVSVATGGGEETNPAWMSKVSDKDLVAAIEQSIRESKLFSAVVSLGGADYVLNATIVNLSQPTLGFDMTVEIEILWSLTPKGATKPVWEKSIKGRATKGVGDAFAGIKRLRITTEAAVKENITEAFKQIGALSLE